jgi:serine/threonine protein kinase
MRPERFEQVAAVVADALSRESPARERWLEEVCAGDPELRREVDSLLAGERAADPFLTGTAVDWAAPLLDVEEPESLVGRRVGPYHLGRLLGSGGMGEVYLARDERGNREVAIKILFEELAEDPEWRRRFLREARLASSLDHPNVCPIFEAGEADGRAFLAMEHLAGKTLRELSGGVAMPTVAWVPLVLQVAEALAAAHARGIVHRDVKTANAIVTPGGVVKVLDFGIAKRLDAELSTTDSVSTRAGTVLGTPGSMAPEQARGEPADERSDVFSLGVVAYELATGRNPFTARTPAESLASLVAIPHRPAHAVVPEVSPQLSAVLDRALAKNPADRHPSMVELMADLRRAAAAAEPGEPAGDGDAAGDSRVHGSGRGWPAGLALLAVLAGLVFLLAAVAFGAPPG